MNVISFQNLYIVFFVPETHHRSVAEIQQYFSGKSESSEAVESQKLLFNDSIDEEDQQ